MLNFSVEISKTDEVRKILGHIPGAAEKAIAKAINKSISKAKKDAIRLVKNGYTVNDYEVDDVKHIKILRASSKRLKATLLATSPLIKIAKFKIKSGRHLVSQIKNGQPKPWPNGFLAKMRGPLGGEHLGLFAREREYTLPTKGRYKDKIKTKEASRGIARGNVGSRIKRQRIFEGFTVSIAQMVGHSEILKEIIERAQTELDGELDRQIELFLSGDQS